MSALVKVENNLVLDEERLFQALIGHGLLTSEEVQAFRQERLPGENGTKELLTQLVKAGYLTQHQGRRVFKDLETYLHQQIPGYELLEKLGQGAMGKVYKARQLSMDRLVAIKILSPKLANDKSYLERFQREAHIAARLSSNNIVQAIDVGSVGPIHYFVMEYVEGTTLKAILEDGKVYKEKEALEIALQIAQALDHAHRRQLIHRDVKPANIIMTSDGIAKLADMGLARRVDDVALSEAEKGNTIGTPFYIAPELIGGETEPDIRADIYSLGATLYHMVTGQYPFAGKGLQQVLQGHLYLELVPPDHVNLTLSAGLGEVVELMMAKDRKERYRTPAELLMDLECLLRGEPPKLARQRIEFGTLEQLASGKVETEEELIVTHAADAIPLRAPWLIALLVALGVSVLLNLFLLTWLAG